LLPKLVENSTNNGMDADRKGCSLTVWSFLNRKSRNSAYLESLLSFRMV
jgi:hypothetical protein